MKEVITSSKNSDIKYLRKLYNARKRRQEGKYILEGSRIIEQALDSGCSLTLVFATPDFDDPELLTRLQGDKLKIRYISRKLLESVADTVSPQGIIALAEKPDYYLSDVLSESQESILVLDRIQDPGNMGTLIRTAAAAGVEGIVALKGCVDIYNLKVLRATMGAVFSIPIITRLGKNEFLQEVNEGDYFLVCTAIDGEQYYYEVEYGQPVVFVIGNEARGIDSDLLKVANSRVKIPLSGEIDSLNAAVSGGIVLYDYLRQKREH